MPPGGDSRKAQSEGIYVARVDQETDQLELIQTVASDNPSFLALPPDQQFLFAINEVADLEGEEVGSVEAYGIDQDSGEIALINRQALPGSIPAHLAVDPSGEYLVEALYRGGSYVVLPIGEDRSLGAPTDEVAQQGSGPNTDDQRHRIRTPRRSIRPAATSPPPISASTRSRSSSSGARSRAAC